MDIALFVAIAWFATFIIPVAILILVISLFFKKKNNIPNNTNNVGFTNKDRAILLLGLILLALFAWPFVSIYFRR